MSLSDLRTRIDAIDDAILELLDERATLTAEIAEAKRAAGMPAYDPARERELLERLAARAQGAFPPAAAKAVFREIMSACLALQKTVRVAYLGPAGTFTHAAARELYGLAATYVEAPTIEGVFDAVERGDADFGVVPIENSTEGSVTNALDALIEGDLRIQREIVLDVAQSLLGTASGLASIERVYSHPQALAQCRVWIAKHLPNVTLVRTTSTAAAVREALGDPSGAAVASRLAGEIYGLPVLAERIQDRPENATRFVTLGRGDVAPSGKDKTTLALSLVDERGALRRVLEPFDDEGINLTRIESRPSRKKAWDYVFLLELEGHVKDEAVDRAIARAAERCAMVKHLGSYPVV